ncbi:unnamed protein product [Rotaria sp. Silwood1]|nr:unnamed protein product [Rotaria sp. Silwood1]CAF3717107.1 unnamed protein product [Rotaria sp. Silwood1]
MGILSIVIITCKIISLACLLVSVYAYHWFQIDNYSVNKDVVQDLCISYGAFCNLEDHMPLPRLIVIAPCAFLVISLVLEIINLSLLCPIWSRVPTLLNCFLEQTSIALSCAVTIHCIWVTIVHIRISMEMRIVHLHGSFFAFGLATILIPVDCICSIIRIMNNCQYDETSETNHEELAILTTLVFTLSTIIFIIVGFIVIKSNADEKFDWSFSIFILSSMLGFTDLICSLVRVVSYCRDNSFRSTLITYTSNENHGIVQIQA